MRLDSVCRQRLALIPMLMVGGWLVVAAMPLLAALYGLADLSQGRQLRDYKTGAAKCSLLRLTTRLATKPSRVIDIVVYRGGDMATALVSHILERWACVWPGRCRSSRCGNCGNLGQSRAPISVASLMKRGVPLERGIHLRCSKNTDWAATVVRCRRFEPTTLVRYRSQHWLSEIRPWTLALSRTSPTVAQTRRVKTIATLHACQRCWPDCRSPQLLPQSIVSAVLV